MAHCICTCDTKLWHVRVAVSPTSRSPVSKKFSSVPVEDKWASPVLGLIMFVFVDYPCDMDHESVQNPKP